MSSIGIVGAGEIGAALAKRLVECGHKVKVANSRGRDTLGEFARNTGAQAADVTDVSSEVDVLIVAVPLGQVPSLPKTLIAYMSSNTIVVDVTNYGPTRDGAIAAIDAGQTESEWVADQLGVPVTKAFSNTTNYSIEYCGKPVGAPGRIALPVNGDDPAARANIMDLVESLGFSAFDAGPLKNSWRQQIGQPAFCTDPDGKQLQKLLARARIETVVANRQQAMELAKKIPENFPKQDLVRAARFMTGIDRLNPSSWRSVFKLVATMVTTKA